MNTFEINIQRKSGNNWPIVVEHSRPGELLSSRSEGILQLSLEDFQRLTSLQGQPKDYGIFLGKALFRDEIRDAFVSALRNSQETLRVLLFIEAEDKELRTLRWERLCANIDDGWHLLSLEQRTPFSLYIPTITDRRFPPIGRRDLRALILVASPSEIERFSLDSFNVEAAVASVRQSLGVIPSDVLATVEDAIGLPTLDELCHHLTDTTKQYTMLHFVSHGKVIDNGETVLYWAKADNKVDPVTGTRLIERLRTLRGAKGLPHFTFLSTCESASPEAEAALGGLGQRLVRDLGMPAVIAMTEKVTVKTALALCAKFYQQLNKSGEVDLALQDASASLAERQDITVPALFSRLGGRPLFSDQLDRDLTNAEIKYGLERLQVFVAERSPILQSKLQPPAEKLRNLLNTDSKALSKQARQEREQALEDVNNLSQAVLDLTFNAVALDQEVPIYDARCPFLGLYPFRVENRKFFFGRERLITQLQQKLAKDNFLAVFGASGSGKSSVVLAGLIPALLEKQPDLMMAYMTPSSNPIKQLQASFLEVQNQASVLVIDQFEELFTLCTDEDTRMLFIDKLLFIIGQQKVVITMRADFWGECASYPQLKELMQSRQELIGPMDTTELRKAMEMQAAQVGLRFEAGLSNSILDDVQGEPGAMPLLQHALLELWKRRHGRWLRTVEYEAIGGVNMAIAQTADAFYDSCTPEEQEQVKNIFIRLTRLDESAVEGQKRRDTRRRVWLDELIPTLSAQSLIKNLLKRLAGEGARLVVTSVDSATQREEVEVAHEALIRYWPRLLNWLDENRCLLLLREKIRQEALEWDNNKKDESYLVQRGGRLEEARKLLQKSNFLNILEANYVRVCVELRDREKQEQETRRCHEIRAKRTMIGGAIVVLVTTSLGLIAFTKSLEAELSKADSLRQNSFLLSKSDKNLQALTDGIKSAKILKNTSFWTAISGIIIKNQDQIDSQANAIAVLQQAIDGVQARNYLTGHRSSVTSVVFSPDGKTIITVSKDNTVKVWNLDGKELTKFSLNFDATLTSVVYSPYGKIIATVSKDNTVNLWDLQGKKLTKITLPHQPSVTNVVFSPDGKTIATAIDNKTVKLWNLQGKELTKIPLPHQPSVTNVVFSPDSKTIATAIDNKTVKLWNLQGQELTKITLPHSVTNVVFSPNGKTIATVSTDKTVKLWDLQGKELTKTPSKTDATSEKCYEIGKPIDAESKDNTVKGWNLIKCAQKQNQPFQHDVEITTLAFSPDGKTIATGTEDNTVILWDLDGNQLQTFKGHEGDITSLAFSPDGSILASASKDNNVILWNLGGKLLQTFTGHQAAVTSVAFSPDGKNIASGSKDNTVQLWDLGGNMLQIFREHKYAVTSVAFSPDSNTLASASEDKTVKLWDLKTNFLPTLNQYAARLTIPGKQAAFTSVVFPLNADERNNGKCNILAAGSKDNIIQLWDLSQNKPHIWDLGQKKPQIFPGHQYAVTSVAISPDCQTLASASVDKTIILWDLKGNKLQAFRGHQAAVTSLAFSRDSKTLASGSDDKTIILWNLNTKKQQEIFKGHQAAVTSVAFSPDGYSLASGSLDNTAILWNLKDKKHQIFRGHQAAVTSVAFSPDSKTLASASDDHTIKLWDLKGKHILEEHHDTVNTVAFSPDGKILASASEDNTIKLWDLKGHLLKTLKNQLSGNETAVKDIVFSADSKTLVYTSEDSTIKLWDFNHPHPVLITLPTDTTLSPDKQTLAFVSADNTIKIWNLKHDLKDSLPTTIKGNKSTIKNILFSPNSQTLASVSEDSVINIWDLKGNLLTSLKKQNKEIKSIVFSPDGKNLISVNADDIVIKWDLQSNQMDTFNGHEHKVKNIALSPDGKIFATVSEDNTIKIWDFNGKLLESFKRDTTQILDIFFADDAPNLISRNADYIGILWDLKGNQLYSFKADDELTNIVFSPNKKTFALASEDKTIKLWDSQGHLLRTLIGHEAGVKSIAFSPDGYTLASGSADNKIILWDINHLNMDALLDSLMVSACNSAKDYLHNSQQVEESDRHLCDSITKETQ
ncbi:eIF2A-related protein [Nostoc sp. ChiVER01]|uniref:nSTAND1 domain-containing NTPase n=1 Tax=Nostoc sp. ChiVER01 TaxID=3075382 RepID=UPI002AD58C49|nr:CHAT domain-containing protein [Nostoc sp. ChiVER01]MDZ8223748.1 CHAT domain-containing protein [Nostoc sp. ChiVER01]